MGRKKKLLPLFFILFSTQVWGSDSLSYSGRLVNANGSPVTGQARLRFDLAYTNDLSAILCTKETPNVDLVNGVFHVKLAFDCSSSTLAKVLEGTPVGNSVAIRVTDLTPTTPKVYSFQALHSIPYSMMTNTAKQLVQMSATSGQVLTWNGSQWSPADPVGTVGGVTTIVGAQGISAVRVDETVTVGIADGGVTAPKLDQMGAASGQVLKWNGSVWAPAADSDTGVASEADPTVRAFARNDVTGIAPEVCNNNQVLRYVSVDNSLRCFDLVDDTIVNGETNKAPSQNAVFDALAGKQDSITSADDITMKTLRLNNDGSTWIGLKAPNAAGNFYFTLPAGAGADGQVLKTDGAGNLSWVTPSSNSASIVDGSIVDADIAAGANIAQSKISGLTTSLTNLQNSITSLTTDDVAEGSRLYFTEARVLSTDLAGLNTTNGTITVADTVLSSIGKLIGNLTVVSTAQSNYVLKSGDTMSGNLQMGGNTVTGLTVPIDDSDAATKKYVDDAAAIASSKWTKNVNDIYYTSGNVGVGVATPLSQFHVASGNYPPARFERTTAGTGNRAATALFMATSTGDMIDGFGSHIDFSIRDTAGVDNNIASIGAMRTGADNSGGIYFMTSSAGSMGHRMRIDPAGKVGIGTTTPEAKLHVVETDGNNIVLSQFTSANGGASIVAKQAKGTSALPTATVLGNRLLGLYGQGYDGTDYSGNDVAIELKASESFTPTANGTVITFATTEDGTTSRVERMRIDDSGNVGVGTTAPVNKLDVIGNVGVSGKLLLKSDTANYVELQAPTGLGATHTYTFPSSTGTVGQALTTDGVGTLSWSDVATTATSLGGDLTGTIANAQLVTGSVGSAEIADLSIANNDIANNTINYAKLFLVDGDIPKAKVNGLVSDLAGKEPVITNPNDPLKYWRGDKTWATLDTAVVPESTNLYFTQQRVLDSLLTGYAGVSASAIPIGDGESVLTSLKKLQLQITANDAAFDASGQWSKNGTSVYYSGGNVGIGTSVPARHLHVYDDSGAGPVVGAFEHNITSGGSSAGSPLLVQRTYSTGNMVDDFGPKISYVIKDDANVNNTIGALAFVRDGADNSGKFAVFSRNLGVESMSLVVTASANVGIGTSSPSAKLHVNSGSIEVSNFNVRKNRFGFHYDQGIDTTVYYHHLGRVSNNDGDMHISGSLSGHDSLVQGKAIIDVFINARNAPYINGVIHGDPVNTNIEVYEDASGHLNVYLKTGTYSQINLDLACTGQAGTYLVDSTKTTTAPSGTLVANVQEHAKLFVRNSGRVGIGTNAPTGNLHVTSSGSTFSVIERPAGQFGVLQFKTLGSARRWELGTDSSSESGADAGSNFGLWRFDDAGNQLGPVLTVQRANGNVDIKGNVRIGNVNSINTGTLPGYGNILYFSGGPAGATWNSDNSDPLWIGRYNVANDQTEFRVNIGDGNSAEDKFVVGYTTAGGYNPTMVVQNNGNVGIGTTTPANKLSIHGSEKQIRIQDSEDASGVWSIGTKADVNNTSLNFIDDDINVRMTIAETGNVGIGNTIPGHKLDVEGNIRTSGCLYYNGGSLGTCASDERLKDEVHPFNLGLDELLGINPVYFKYNGLGGLPTDGGEQLGVIAQDVEKVAPSLVVKRKVKLNADDKFDTEIKAVDYGAFTYVIINSLKEMYGMVQELFDSKEEVNREIASIKAENEAMKAYICQKDPEAPFCKK